MAATPGGNAPKVIAVFSDGTGNSSAKLFKTNVWRVYQALDLGRPAAGHTRQIAYYDDGVGTSSFRPLALLGGAVGLGLARNVLDLYKFLCRHYEEGDRIYAFGFSRGAFTIRVLVGLVATQGLVAFKGEADLDLHALDAYRRYRKECARRPIRGAVRTIWHVEALRALRDRFVEWRRKRQGFPRYDDLRKRQVPEIDFIGVWDTVSAYGMPIAELTVAVDKWIWPLSMPDYKLSGKVKAARHALALDDERDTFHPLLWDEVESERPERIRQVWFAGMHSDVGGGYPDDGLSQLPLLWMMEEAERAGLRFRANALPSLRDSLNRSAPMHDSRRGMAAYYRYQPRKLSARMAEPDPTALIMRSPNDRGRLASARIHASVLERIRSGPDGYAPIGLPESYQVVCADAGKEPPSEAAAAERRRLQQWIWNDVWRRRVNYFLTVGLSLPLFLLPFIQLVWPPSDCAGPGCVLAPAIGAARAVLPGLLAFWTDAFAASPHVFLGLLIGIGLLMARAGRLQKRIDDETRELWRRSIEPQAGAEPPAAAAREGQLRERFIRSLWTSALYQRALRMVKWRIVPGVFGNLVRIAVVAALLAAVLWAFSILPRS